TPDGRYVAFVASGDNIIPNDTNGGPDVFVRDLLNETTERVSVQSGGAEAVFGGGAAPSISADGGYVSFMSVSPSFGAPGCGSFGWCPNQFLHDRQTGITELVSVNMNGQPSVGAVSGTVLSLSTQGVSGDGRFVAFMSDATDLVPNDT